MLEYDLKKSRIDSTLPVRLQEITRAMDVLSNESARAAYDLVFKAKKGESTESLYEQAKSLQKQQHTVYFRASDIDGYVKLYFYSSQNRRRSKRGWSQKLRIFFRFFCCFN